MSNKYSVSSVHLKKIILYDGQICTATQAKVAVFLKTENLQKIILYDVQTCIATWQM